MPVLHRATTNISCELKRQGIYKHIGNMMSEHIFFFFSEPDLFVEFWAVRVYRYSWGYIRV